MRTTRTTLVAFLCLATTQIWAVEPAKATLTETLKLTQAVAYVQVVQSSEKLQEKRTVHTATLLFCGRTAGLDERTQLEITWDVPEKPEETMPDAPASSFTVGDRCLILLANRAGRWETVRQIKVSPEGRILETDVGAEIGLQPGIDADSAVKLIEVHLKKPGRRSTQRIAPPPPKARNQPWKLMRTSPLRKIWPFIPH